MADTVEVSADGVAVVVDVVVHDVTIVSVTFVAGNVSRSALLKALVEKRKKKVRFFDSDLLTVVSTFEFGRS